MAAVADDLKRVALFADLSGRQRRKLAGNFRERTYKPGADVVREGSMSGIGFFVVTEGEAAVSARGKTLTTLKPGDYFGELALITKAERTATVTARSELHCLEIPFYDFRRFANANPDIMWKLLQHLASLLQKPTG